MALAVAVGVVAGTSAALPPVQSEDDNALLLSTRSLRCSFDWTAHLHPTTVDRPTVDTVDDQFQIDGIDHTENLARMIGNVAAADFVVLSGVDGLSFIETTPSGAVNLTTVYAWRYPDGSFMAAYSRHTALLGPFPQQLYGRCEPWD